MTQSSPYRLPPNVRPTAYRLTLTPDLENFTFTGHVSIDLQVSESTGRFLLNAAELEITAASVTDAYGGPMPASGILLDEKRERAYLTFPREIATGRATLSMEFSGILNDQLRGFYRCRYTDADGAERNMAATQFEATDARRAFPCWDEPAAKATFELTLRIPSELTAVSNTMPEAETPAKEGTKEILFAPTPKMSTYLLAFIVGDLAAVEERAPNGTLVRIWATRGKEEQGRFALETAVDLLTYLDFYFGIPYPLEKLDHLALPDFAAGAMENWGAITYREIALLFDPVNSAANTRQRIAEIVAHEMAHMWFGDLVTMEWWDDLWLNESFASWMGNKAVDHIRPEWDMWTQFVYQDTNGGLSLDGLKNSHPIEMQVANPAEIGELFDAISYNKGGAVLRMLEDFLGEETFRQGIHHYLRSHQYGNARTEDLWASLEQVSGKPITTIMNTWVKQAGYPVVTVEESTDAYDGAPALSLTQSRFLYDRLLSPEDDDPARWQAPISIQQAGVQSKVAALMVGDTLNVPLDSAGDSGWVKVNAGQTGFYRVNYDADQWKRLGEAVGSMELPATDRLGLQNDAYALMRAGSLSPATFLALAENYRGETHVSVWSDLASNLGSFDNLIGSQPYYDRFLPFAQGIFRKAAQRIGWEPRPDEGHLDTLLRTTILGQLGAYGDEVTIQEARARFDRFLERPESLPPDLRGMVISLTAQAGDGDTFDTLLQLEDAADLQEEKMRLLRALTRFQREDLLQKTLDLTLSPRVRTQDTVSLVIGVAVNRIGGDMAWEFIKNNWDEFNRRYGAGGFAIMHLVSIIGRFTTLEHAADVEAFFAEHPAPGAQRTIQQSLERIRINARWLEVRGAEAGEWLSARS